MSQNNIESWNNRTKEETLPVLCRASRGISVLCRLLALARQTTYPLVHNQERSVLPQPMKGAGTHYPGKMAQLLAHYLLSELGWSMKSQDISANIDTSCDCCKEVPPESLIHRFHHCSKAAHVWRYAKTLLYPYVNLLLLRSGLTSHGNNASWDLLFRIV